MTLSDQLITRFHQTSVSSIINRTPGVSTVAKQWWVHVQEKRFRAAISALGAPRIPASEDDPLGRASVPTDLEAHAKLPPYVLAGEAFSNAMSESCTTSKFLSITRLSYSQGYQDIYAAVLGHLADRRVRVLEIGIGVNDPNARSGMSYDHTPGASLKGWSQYLKGSEVHGADIDKRCLVDTEWYTTHHVDQRDPSSLAALATVIGPPLDLIVDDGLHTPEANGNTMAALLPLLSPSGVMVVEDILSKFDPLWKGLSGWLRSEYEVRYFPYRLLRQDHELGGTCGIAIITRRV
jgi:hypothetical protein